MRMSLSGALAAAGVFLVATTALATTKSNQRGARLTLRSNVLTSFLDLFGNAKALEGINYKKSGLQRVDAGESPMNYLQNLNWFSREATPKMTRKMVTVLGTLAEKQGLAGPHEVIFDYKAPYVDRFTFSVFSKKDPQDATKKRFDVRPGKDVFYLTYPGTSNEPYPVEEGTRKRVGRRAQH